DSVGAGHQLAVRRNELDGRATNGMAVWIGNLDLDDCGRRKHGDGQKRQRERCRTNGDEWTSATESHEYLDQIEMDFQPSALMAARAARTEALVRRGAGRESRRRERLQPASGPC